MALWRVPHCRLLRLAWPSPAAPARHPDAVAGPDADGHLVDLAAGSAKAMEELNKKGATHQQDAAKQIEESR